MATRNYTGLVTVTVVSPDGKILGTKSEEITLPVDLDTFPGSEEVCDRYVEGELSTLLAAAANNAEECFK